MSWQSVLGVGGKLLSLGAGFKSLFGGNKSANRAQRWRNEDMAWAREQFNEQMDSKYQRAVLDAKKAGLHPLAVLGTSLGASPTLSSGQSPEAGDALKSSGLNALMRAISEATVTEKKASARKDEADAALSDAKTATLSQRLASQGRDGMEITEYPSGGRVATYSMPQNDFDSGVVFGPPELYNPPIPTSSRPGVQSGVLPARIEVTDPAGSTYTLPNPDLGLDEVGQLEYILGAPARVYRNLKQGAQKSVEIMTMERELNRLRSARIALNRNPQKAAEYKRLRARVRAKIKALYDQLRRNQK